MSEDCKDCGNNPTEQPGESRKPESPASGSVAEASGQTTLKVAGMDCPDEIAAIERVLKPLAGIRGVNVNLMAGTATIVHDQQVTASFQQTAARRSLPFRIASCLVLNQQTPLSGMEHKRRKQKDKS